MFFSLMIVLTWWLIGVVGLAIAVWSDFDNDLTDITIGKLFDGMKYALAGPIIWIILAMYVWDKIDFTPLTKWWNNIMDIKIINNSKPKKVKPKKEGEMIFTNHKPTYDRMQEINKRKAEPSEQDILKSNILEE